jgi:hypothetical protein
MDAGGNTDQSAASYVWMVLPDTEITSSPPKQSKDTSVSFYFTSPGSISAVAPTFECSLDNAVFASCANPQSYARLKAGNHNFTVRATLGGGMTDPTPASYDWTIDTTAPGTIISSKPPVNSTDPNPSFSFTSSEADSTFECSLDTVNSGAFVPCASPQQYFGVPDGKRTFQVRAVDPAGNPARKTAKYSWKLDATPPETSITMSPMNPTTSTTAVFKFASSEKSIWFQCNLDGGGFSACPRKFLGLSKGNHYLAVRAVDAFGNVDPTPASFSWTIQ